MNDDEFDDRRQLKYLGSLPHGYSYQLMKFGDRVRAVGANPNRPPIIVEFMLDFDVDLNIKDEDDYE